MTITAQELLLKMQGKDFIFDTAIGKMVNKKYQEDKDYVIKILSLLYTHFERVVYVDDLSDSITGKGKWAMLISEKYAIADKRLPLPQVPFHMRYEKTISFIRPKYAYLMLIGFFQELDEEIYVSLNFKDEALRKEFKQLAKDKELKSTVKK